MSRTYAARTAHSRDAACGAQYLPEPYAHVPVIKGMGPNSFPPWINDWLCESSTEEAEVLSWS